MTKVIRTLLAIAFVAPAFANHHQGQQQGNQIQKQFQGECQHQGGQCQGECGHQGQGHQGQQKPAVHQGQQGNQGHQHQGGQCQGECGHQGQQGQQKPVVHQGQGHQGQQKPIQQGQQG